MLENRDVSFKIGKCDIKLSTGKFAEFANGSCLVSCGDTVVFSSVCYNDEIVEGVDFFPLQVEYRENYSASGIIPGGYIKREGKPSDREILISRMADRSVRPLFPNNYYHEVQICSELLSYDKTNESDFLSIIGTSLALTLSDLPFDGPIGALRVGFINDDFVANPTIDEMKNSKLDLIYAGRKDKVIMIEGDASEISELEFKRALEFANEHIQLQIDAQLELLEKCGKKKAMCDEVCNNSLQEETIKIVNDFCDKTTIKDDCFIVDKQTRNKKFKLIFDDLKNYIMDSSIKDDISLSSLKMLYDEYIKKIVRFSVINDKKRIDGRRLDQLRNIELEIGVLPKRVHGSSLFSRGNTQSLCMITLGSTKDAQELNLVTSANKSDKKNFYLHYNFPGYSVGEVKKLFGPGRREIGHGNLAERSLIKVIPADYEYVVRCVSKIMASNGSTSMASVCSGSLALMDAGVPIKKHVAGISCGLIKESDKEELLLDITGPEDHYGDMDFKVAGTRDGITGFQLDLKISGISIELLFKAMMNNKFGRESILDKMNECILKPNNNISEFAPKTKIIKISTEKIGMLIGPGGKNIKSLTEDFNVSIDIENDGTVKIFSEDSNNVEEVVKKIMERVTDVTVTIGQVYNGTIKSIIKSGVFVEFLPGRDGFVHVSELTGEYIKDVSSLYKNGDKLTVTVTAIDGGRVRLSCKDKDSNNSSNTRTNNSYRGNSNNSSGGSRSDSYNKRNFSHNRDFPRKDYNKKSSYDSHDRFNKKRFV